MRVAYSKWIPGKSQTAEDRLKQLLGLFSQLLLTTSGDVNEVLEWMRYLDEQYKIFGPDMTLDMFKDELKRMGLIEEDENALLKPTNKAIQNIRRDALLEMFRSLRKSPSGAHDTPHTGSGIERTQNTKPYNFGDQSSNIDFTQTFLNAQKRALRENDDDDRSEPSSFITHPSSFVSIEEDDIEIYETEHLTSCATVLMIDISHSMILYGEDRITPAKKVALALSELIKTKFPKDQLYVVTFGDEAKLITVSELPFLEVGPFHTNTKAGLRLARQLLIRSGNVNKQIFMVTDGKPSAMFDDAGRLYKNSFGLDPKIVNKTLDEALACRREKITISTFMVARDPYLIGFVEELTKSNKGRAYYSGLNDLGQFVFVDYVRNRKKKYPGSRD
ncbi:MAG: VWA domain-containing protein [Bacteroidota bacterium]|nr:VWA domain-containing protein [Bacteroidota bacterium]MDP4233655.1 VWA domain-containing protein [Bacteroidota bacterium]MDP4243085.1 VWA domain-containing protein [Bacteroidota bacterium]MDP4288469.1 VWA domain-containing protein [Bacteroidota bacterium]